MLRGIPGVLERFWDMFVVDAFLKNPDRNNGNWGILMADGEYSLAPVYDLGSSLFSKRASDVAAERMEDRSAMEQDALSTNVSCYRLVDERGGSQAIHLFEYMASTDNPDLRAAIHRFVDAVDMDAVDSIIDEVPEEAYGTILLSGRMRESHKRLLRMRYEEGFLPLSSSMTT